ncbi:MAG: hypothetical protein V4465_00720 [Patescibacteria group bacterium]
MSLLPSFKLQHVGIGLMMAFALPVSANIDTWQKGVTIMPGSAEEYARTDFKESIDAAFDAHVNSVALVIPLYQDALTSSEVHDGWNTPSDESLQQGIEYIHSKNMRVMLKLHLYPGNEWSGRIRPADTDQWFKTYENLVLKYAGIAEREGVETLCIGSEIIPLSTNTKYQSQWRDIISRTRLSYAGELTYSANWGPGIYDEKNKVTFWPELDYIGISAYFPIKKGTDWSYWDRTQISALQKKYEKPVLFTEIGYRSIAGALANPWDYTLESKKDDGEQVRAFQKLFDYWKDKDNFGGMYIWSWKGTSHIDTSGKDYTPQGKPALEVIKKEFTSHVQPAVVVSTQASVSAPSDSSLHWYKSLISLLKKTYIYSSKNLEGLS